MDGTRWLGGAVPRSLRFGRLATAHTREALDTAADRCSARRCSRRAPVVGRVLPCLRLSCAASDPDAGVNQS